MAFQLTKFWANFVHYSVRYEAKRLKQKSDYWVQSQHFLKFSTYHFFV
jgi:hypothetical protein